MALCPFLWSDLLDDFVVPVGSNLQLGMLGDNVLPYYLAPTRTRGQGRGSRRQATRVQSGKPGFKVNLDVQQFRPEEITVKLVDNFVVVEGKHEERQDAHGFVARQFQRRYELPNDVDAEKLSSKLSSDGVLTITAPKKPKTPPPANEREIPIIQTQQPVLKQAGTTVQPGAAAGDVAEPEKMEQ